jgi:hypothetical protein
VRLAAVALLAAAVVAGCGSSALSSPVALRTRATDACRDTSPVIPPAAPEPTPKQLVVFLSEGAQGLKKELSQLRRLHLAAGEVDTVFTTALTAVQGQVSALDQTVEVIKGGEDPVLAFKALQQKLGPLEKQADNAWSALQIPACLEG